VDPQKAEAIDQFLLKLRSLGSGEAAFTFILDDSSGNSFIENPYVFLDFRIHIISDENCWKLRTDLPQKT
jgi:C4-type Zn-finger protein